MSEWMKIMLEEIARKKVEAEQGCAEEQRRRDEVANRDGAANEAARVAPTGVAPTGVAPTVVEKQNGGR